ncbi:hypothetical protein [Clostridium baratii]|uniref:hypothetical protein n=1 Tax=Clostridium baratii TaxID=1561 RepID=UPI0030CB6B57
MNEEKARRAYDYLIKKYPETPNISGERMKREIRNKFELEEKEEYAAFYGWKRKVTKILDRPKLKDLKERNIKDNQRFMWSENLEKLKELYARYKLGEDIEKLALEVGVDKESILNTFSRYKRIGVLHGERMFRKNFVIIDGKKFTPKAVENLVIRVNNGEKIKDLAKELKVDIRYLSNAYYYHRKKVKN